MTRRAAAATTASSSGSRSSASGRRARGEQTDAGGVPTTAKPAKATKAARASKATRAKAPRPKGRAAATRSPDAVGPPAVPVLEAPRRTRAKRGHGDQLREQILDATHALLAETGSADKVSTRAVAQRVGCSSPALYLHFPDKASLLWATCNRQFLRLGELVATAVAGVEDPVEALRSAGRAYITFGVEHAEEYRVMMMVPDVVMWNPPIDQLPAEAGFDVLHDLIVRAMAQGLLRDDDPTMVAITVWAAVHGIVALRVAKPSFEWPPIAQQIDHMLNLITIGLGPVPDPGASARSGRKGPRSRRTGDRSTR